MRGRDPKSNGNYPMYRVRAKDSSRSTTCSTESPSVETWMASAAGSSGPTARPASSWSRRRWAARISSKVAGSPRSCRSRQPAPGPFGLAGGEKELAGRVGKDDGSLIAAFADEVVPGRDGPLQFHQVPADAGVVGGVPGDGGHFPTADRLGNVLAVEEDAVVGQAEVDLPGQFGQGFRPVPIDAAAHACQGHRPIHRPRVEKAESQSSGQRPGHGALACAGRSVNGDNHGRSFKKN